MDLYELEIIRAFTEGWWASKTVPQLKGYGQQQEQLAAAVNYYVEVVKHERQRAWLALDNLASVANKVVESA